MRRLYRRRLRILLIFIPCRAARRARYGSMRISGCDMDGGRREEAQQRVGAIGVVRFVGWLPAMPHRQHVIHFTRAAAGRSAQLPVLPSTPPPAAAAAAPAPSEIFLLRLIIGRRG